MSAIGFTQAMWRSYDQFLKEAETSFEETLSKADKTFVSTVILAMQEKEMPKRKATDLSLGCANLIQTFRRDPQHVERIMGYLGAKHRRLREVVTTQSPGDLQSLRSQFSLDINILYGEANRQMDQRENPSM